MVQETYSFVGAFGVDAAGVDAESDGAGDEAATGARLRFLEGCVGGGTEPLEFPLRIFSGGGEDMGGECLQRPNFAL